MEMILLNIYVDDLRLVPQEFDLVFRTGEHLLEFLSGEDFFEIDTLSLDHDLGEHLMNGYDLTKEIINLIQEGKITVKKMIFHTANPTGHKNMIKYVENANKRLDLGIMIDSNFYGF